MVLAKNQQIKMEMMVVLVIFAALRSLRFDRVAMAHRTLWVLPEDLSSFSYELAAFFTLFSGRRYHKNQKKMEARFWC